MDIATTFFEILKYTIPSVIVYLLFRQFIRYQIALERSKKSGNAADILPSKLQAYERLALFVERIILRNLIMRLQGGQMSTSDYKNALLISVQKEFEHNVTQQIYVSQQLWDMIKLLKDQTIVAITDLYLKNEKEAASVFSNAVMTYSNTMEENYNYKILNAIRTEVGLISED